MELNEKPTSIKKTFSTLKGLNGTYILVALLLVLPIAFTAAYGFYRDYSHFAINPDAFANIGETITSPTEFIDSFLASMQTAITNKLPDYTAGDTVISVVNYLLKLVFFAFSVIFALCVGNNVKADATDIIGKSIRKLPAMIFVSIFVSWIAEEVKSVASAAAVSFIAFQKGLGTFALAIPSTAIVFCVVILLATFIMQYVYFSVITIMKQRSKAFFSLGYSRAIMKGKKQFSSLILWVIAVFVLPLTLGALAPYFVWFGIIPATVFAGVCEALFVLLNSFMLIYLVPRHDSFEKESGIIEKMKKAYEEAMKRGFSGGIIRVETEDGKEDNKDNETGTDKEVGKDNENGEDKEN